MRKLIPLTISFCLLLIFSAESSPATSHLPLNFATVTIVQPQNMFGPVSSVQKKMKLKDRLLLKWYKKKQNRIISEEQEKKKIILLGKLSLWGAIGGILLAVVPMGFIFSIFLIPGSFILGIKSLHRRKKFANKSEINKWPALIGVMLSGLVILLIGSYLLYYAISGSD